MRVSLNKKLVLAACLGFALLSVAITYRYLSREIVIYENSNIDGRGFKALVTCRPDEMFTYYPYLVIETPRRLEVSRSQINGLGYDASKACLVSFPVGRLEMTADQRVVRVHFEGRNAFGDTDSLDVPVRYFSPR